MQRKKTRKMDLIRSAIFLVAILPMATISLAQQTAEGIHFEKGLSWSEVVAKAKATNKHIFVDCYASWCGPCKWMDKNVFPLKEVGDFFNANFISVSIQMDEPEGQTEAAQQRFRDAKAMEQRFNIKAVPTYLFFGPDGTPVHKVSTGAKKPSAFIALSREALDPGKQYYTVLRQYPNYKNDSVYLQSALSTVLTAKDSAAAAAIADIYQAAIRNPLAKDAISIICPTVTTTSSKGFLLLLENASDIGAGLGNPDKIHTLLAGIFIKEQLVPLFERNPNTVKDFTKWIPQLRQRYPSLQQGTISQCKTQFDAWIGYFGVRKPIYAKGAAAPDWTAMLTRLSKQFPSTDVKRMIVEEKPKYYKYKRDWRNCAQAALALLAAYGENMDGNKVNLIVWDNIFLNCTDKALLEQALRWSKRTVDQEPSNYVYLDTYANLLYKLGNKAEAIRHENKAIELIEAINPADKENMKDLQEARRKMLSGEPTWQDGSTVPAV